MDTTSNATSVDLGGQARTRILWTLPPSVPLPGISGTTTGDEPSVACRPAGLRASKGSASSSPSPDYSRSVANKKTSAW